MNRLQRVIQEKNIDVVILDSLTSIQRKSGLNYKDPEYGNLIYDFKEIASSLKVTPIIVVHTNKAQLQEVGLEKIAGSYAIGAAASEVFLLDKPKELRQDLKILIRAKSRRFPMENFLLDFNPDNYSFEILGQCDRLGQLKSENPNLPEGKIDNARSKILKFLTENPGIKWHPQEISKHLNLANSTVRKELANIYKHHLCCREKTKEGNFKDQIIYFMPLPILKSSLSEEEVARLINLSANNLNDFIQQFSQLSGKQKDKLISYMPSLQEIVEGEIQ